ncbi:MAG TPA: AI-2E family transporter [bacterium]|nr:AI-2E family transporter [bacterium]
MDQEIKQSTLDISWGTIFRVALAIICFYLLYLIKDILVWFLFALIISVLFEPMIVFFQKRKVPRKLSVVFIYFGFFSILAFLIYLITPLFISEIHQFSQFFPQYFEEFSPFLRGLGLEAFENLEKFIEISSQTLNGMSSNFFSALFAIFGGVFSTLFVITLSAFLSLEYKGIEKALVIAFPKKYESYVLSLWKKTRQKVIGWFGIKIIGVFFIGTVSFIGFLLFNVKYPSSLALIAGVLDFIPIIGPLIAGVIAFLFISMDSLTKAVFVLIFFTILQTIEANILIPILGRKLIGLPPVIVLIALAIGWTLFGLLGAILFTPLAAMIYEFTTDFLKKKKDEETVVL